MNKLLIPLFLFVGVATSAQKAREYSGVDGLIIGNTQRVVGIQTSLGSNSDFFLPTVGSVKRAIDALSLSATGNVLNAINISSYGAVANASVAGGADTATGTDAAPAINQAIANAAWGQLIIIGYGDWVLHTPITTFKDKRITIWIFGRLHCNKRSCFRILPPSSGPDPQHDIELFGEATGVENLTYHNKTPLGRTGPNWSTMAVCSFVEFGNTNKNHIRFNKIIGFYNAFYWSVGGGGGSQENNICGQYIVACANAINMTSYDGNSYCDKNVFTGPDGALMHIDAGLGWRIDGFSGVYAGNGEVYNGSFNSNKAQNVLFEKVDSVFEWNGDITETNLGIEIEGGANTGVFGTQVFKMRSVSPNFVRNNYFHGCRYMYLPWFNGATLGIGGRFEQCPLYTNPGANLIGSAATIDQSGNVVLQILSNVTQAQIAALPPIFKVVPVAADRKDVVSITAATYTPGAGVAYVEYNNNAGTLTLPSASANPLREITVLNLNPNPLAVVGMASIASMKGNVYFCDGANWFSKGDGNGPSLVYSWSGSIAVTAATTTKTSIVNGGLKTFTGANLQPFDRMVITGTGSVTIPGPGTYVNAVVSLEVIAGGNTQNYITYSDGNGSAKYNAPAGGLSSPKMYKYKFTITPQASGTSVNASYDVEIFVAGEFNGTAGSWVNVGTGTISGFNTVSPTYNVSATWSTTATNHTWTALTNSVEFLRQ